MAYHTCRGVPPSRVPRCIKSTFTSCEGTSRITGCRRPRRSFQRSPRRVVKHTMIHTTTDVGPARAGTNWVQLRIRPNTVGCTTANQRWNHLTISGWSNPSPVTWDRPGYLPACARNGRSPYLSLPLISPSANCTADQRLSNPGQPRLYTTRDIRHNCSNSSRPNRTSKISYTQFSANRTTPVMCIATPSIASRWIAATARWTLALLRSKVTCQPETWVRYALTTMCCGAGPTWPSTSSAASHFAISTPPYTSNNRKH